MLITTKQAVLPSGEVMHFPLDTPDEHVHAQVRQRMGLPPPDVMPPKPSGDQFGAVLGHLARMGDAHSGTVSLLHNTVERATQAHTATLQELMRHSAESSAQMVDAIHRVAELATRIEESNQAVIKALRAKKTVTKGKNGSFSLDVADE